MREHDPTGHRVVLWRHQWETLFEPWLAKRGERPFSTHDILVGTGVREADKINRADEMAVAGVLRRMGWVQRRLRVDGGRTRLWNSSESAEEAGAMKEHDPTGRDQHEPGAKCDGGKLLPSLVLGRFARALEAVALVGTYGAQKYTPRGWETVPNGIERYSEALMRHWLAEQQGIELDDETRLLHASHLAWNALARLELMLRELEGSEP